ncbi:MAG: hypothetical protein H6706_24820 [Myxococcales bacterium]|nr:hypothetical protein [Myxococcales bacterium]
MKLAQIIKIALVAVVLLVGVKFSLAYINYLQISRILDAEALDARRTKTSAEEIIRRIQERAGRSSAELPPPEAIDFTVEGVNEPNEDLVITASYEEIVNLYVYVVRWPRTIVARAETPKK